MTPARRTEPAVGASTCASGSQVWKGTAGILTANPKNSIANTRIWNTESAPGIHCFTNAKLKSMVPLPARYADSKTMLKIPISMTSDATWV